MPYTGKNNRPPAYRGQDGQMHDDWQYDATTDQWFIPREKGGAGPPTGKVGGQLPGSQPGSSFTPTAFRPSTGSTGSMNNAYGDPTRQPPPDANSGWKSYVWDGLKWIGGKLADNAGSLINAGGQVLQTLESEKQTAAKLAEQKAEFEANLKQRQAEEARAASQFGRTTGNEEAQAAVRAQTQLNKAPIADKAQALILARMGVSPGQFKPRDYTQGQASLTTPNAAPGANVASTMQHAASAYTPGSGGVNTDYLKALIAKMSGSSGLPTKPTAPTEPPYKPQFPITNGPPPVKPTIRPPVTPIQPLTDQPPDAYGQDSNTKSAPTDNSDENPKDPSTFLLRKMRPLY